MTITSACGTSRRESRTALSFSGREIGHVALDAATVTATVPGRRPDGAPQMTTTSKERR